MNDPRFSRRHVLGAMSAGSLGSALLASRSPAAEESDGHPASAKEALARLLSGNERFVQGKPAHDHSGTAFRKTLLKEQHPIAVIVGCADSRVPIELIFDQGFGDLFVIRNAGNVIMTDVLGSIEYAALHLGTPLVVVMGHEGCGAVTAALKTRDEKQQEPRELRDVLRMIDPALKGLPQDGTPTERLARAVTANVRWSVKEMKRLQRERNHKAEKIMTAVGAVYSLKTGKVSIV